MGAGRVQHPRHPPVPVTDAARDRRGG
jgi:hypothetical protein